MKGTAFTDDLSSAAALAQENSRNGLLVHIELGKYGFVVIGAAPSLKRAVVRDFKQVVSYRDVELSDGVALVEAIRKVVAGLGFEFLANPKQP